MTFEEMWADLAPVGRSARTGGYFRQAFTSAEEEAQAWFVAEAERRGLRVETDGFGNRVAWWGEPSGDGVLTGSHLDSVLDGGAYDGPLGVVSAFAAVDLLRERGLRPARAIGVVSFREEEGSRFPMACLGSRLATGTLDWRAARELRDRDGVALGDVTGGVAHRAQPPSATESGDRAQRRAQRRPQEGPALRSERPSRSLPGGLLDDVGVFVELHVEQGRDLVHRDQPVAAAEGVWPHGRYRFDFAGRADHAGTTRMEDRHDPMLTYATAVLAANERARAAGQRATFGRVDVRPGSTNGIPSLVTGWLDARAESAETLDRLVDTIARAAYEGGARDGTSVEVTHESVSTAVRFDPDLTARVAGVADLPVIPTPAGHDAAILAGAGIPAAMLFVRNPTGVSHSPEEHAETADCLTGVEVLAGTLELLAGSSA
jgi:beta-ureidopropionase / N-carbamoyl-L-amino-acid hydrolase